MAQAVHVPAEGEVAVEPHPLVELAEWERSRLTSVIWFAVSKAEQVARKIDSHGKNKLTDQQLIAASVDLAMLLNRAEALLREFQEILTPNPWGSEDGPF